MDYYYIQFKYIYVLFVFRAAGNVNIINNNARRSVKSIILEPGNMQLETGGDKIRVSVSPR